MAKVIKGTAVQDFVITEENRNYEMVESRELFHRHTGNFETTCNCCSSASHETRTITLACNNGTKIKHSYNFITACICQHTNCFIPEYPWWLSTTFELRICNCLVSSLCFTLYLSYGATFRVLTHTILIYGFIDLMPAHDLGFFFLPFPSPLLS